MKIVDQCSLQRIEIINQPKTWIFELWKTTDKTTAAANTNKMNERPALDRINVKWNNVCIPVAHLCKVAPMAKFEYAPFLVIKY